MTRWLAARVVLVGLVSVSACGNDPAANDDAAAADGPVDVVVEAPSSDGSAAACGGGVPPDCVSDCASDRALVSSAACGGGAWICPSGYVWRDSCAPDACGVALRQCCDAVTGVLTDNACGADGKRAPCPAGTRPGSEYSCVPDSAPDGCKILNAQPCDGTAQRCRDVETVGGEGAISDCTCGLNGAPPQRTWQCTDVIGP